METVEHTSTMIHLDPSKNGNEKFKDLTFNKKKKNHVTVL